MANPTPLQNVFAGAVLLALVAGLALPVYKVSSTALIQRDLLMAVTGGEDDGLSADLENGTADPWAGWKRMNVLLIGSDAGRGRIGTRPDTMIIASIDVQSGNTVLFSLPRNLEKAPFPKGTPGRRAYPDGFDCPADACLLNAVWQWAENAGKEYYGGKNPGLQATQDAIRGVTGLKINTWVSLNLKGFREFVDAIGGVTVDVQDRLPIGGNSDPNSPYYKKASGWIEPGRQKLDGYHALWFARSRWTTTDFHRMRRQRCVIGAVVQQADPTTVARNFPQVAKAAKGNIGTGIKTDDLDAWVTLALRIKDAKVTSLPFDDKVVTDRTNPDYDRIRKLVKQAIRDSTAPAGQVTPTATPSPSPSASDRDREREQDTEKDRTKGGTTTETEENPGLDPTKAQSITEVC